MITKKLLNWQAVLLIYEPPRRTRNGMIRISGHKVQERDESKKLSVFTVCKPPNYRLSYREDGL